MLQVDQVAAVGAEESAAGEPLFKFSEGKLGGEQLLGGLQVGAVILGGNKIDLGWVDQRNLAFQFGGHHEGK